MAATIIDGKAVAARLQEQTRLAVASLVARGVTPGLAVVLVGDDPASTAYVTMKERDCEQVGIRSFDTRLPGTTTQAELERVVEGFNADPAVHGILVQLPLPGHLDTEAAIAHIAPEKDVDAFHPATIGRLVRGLPALHACTPEGVMELLRAYDINPEGKRAVVVGRSVLVGKPMALLLLEAHATVTVCHSRTRDLPAVCREADILVAAIGRPEMIDERYVKPGAVVIDVGITKVDGRLVGDVAFDRVARVAGAITPVPGGVGPMTRAVLLRNTVAAAARAVS